MNVLKVIRAILLLPGVVTVLVPAFILYSTRTVNLGWSLPPLPSLAPPLAGVVAISIGLVLMFKTISLFATMGRGTLAPWDPPQKLVVHGIYRHMRNPMITGVFCILLGEAILFGSIPLLYWLAIFTALNLMYVPFVEEPALAQRFGEAYMRYRKNVPRWIPRWKAWEDDNGH